MRSIQISILSPSTIDLLCYELDEMLKHCDLSQSQSDEIAEILGGLQECDEIRLQLSLTECEIIRLPIAA
jgi:hypothetical protein